MCQDQKTDGYQMTYFANGRGQMLDAPYDETATNIPAVADRRRTSVTMIVPTLNEALNLPYVLPKIPSWVDEIIIVDGLSSDNTVEVARRLRPDVKVVIEARKGKGAALQAGFAAATGDVIIIVDADGSMDPAEAILFLEALKSGAEFVKGSRFLSGGGTDDMSTFRMVGNWGLTKVVQLLYGVKHSDLCYGYIGFWRRTLHLLNPKTDGFEIDALLNLRALSGGLKVVEVPSFEAKRVHGESNLRAVPDGWRVLKTIIKERATARFGSLEGRAGQRFCNSDHQQGLRLITSGGGTVLNAGDRAPLATQEQGRKLRVLMVCARYLPLTGGTEQHVHEVASRMAKLGHHVTVLTTCRDGSLPAAEVREGINIIRCPASPVQRDWYWAPDIWRQIAKDDWDLIHVQGWHTFVAPIAMAAAIRKGLPFVLTFHSGGHSSASRNSVRGLQARILRPLVRRAHQLICVSRYEAEYFSHELAILRERFRVIGNGAQMPNSSALPFTVTQGRMILSVGRLERYKGHHRVIKALPLVLARLPDLRLRIVGDGPYESELRKLVTSLRLEEKVEIGKIPPSHRTAMSDAMASAALVTLVSEYEAHPVSVMESVSLGTPVLTTDTSGFIELIESGRVRSVPYNASTEVLAQAIIDNIEAPRPSKGLILPSWEDCTTELLQTYFEVVGAQK